MAALALALLTIAAAPAAAASWSVAKLADDQVIGPMFAASCPSTSFCVVGGSDRLIATSIAPTTGAKAWRVFHPGGAEVLGEVPLSAGPITYPGSQVRGLSCPTTQLCIGVTLDGKVLSSANPSGGAGAWKLAPLSEGGPNIHMTGVSCPTAGFCAAVAYGGKVLSSHDPSGGAGAWQVTQLEAQLDFRGVSCPTESFCAAVGNEGAIAVSTDPDGPASAWQLAGQPGGASALNGISCPSSSLCVTGNAGQMISSANPTGGAGAWHAVPAGTGLPIKGVSCPAPSACAAVDNNSDALLSTEPTGANWSFTNVIPAPLSGGGGPNGMFAISCPTTGLCLAAGASEQIIYSTDPFTPSPVEPVSRKRGLRVLITRHPAKRLAPRRHGARVAFRFHAAGGRATRFLCRLSGTVLGSHRTRHRGGFSTCRSPARYRAGRGAHVFRVRAIGSDDTRSPITSFHFRVGPLKEPQPVGSCNPDGSSSGPCIRSR